MNIEGVTISTRLNPGELACGACGVAVPGPHMRDRVTIHRATTRIAAFAEAGPLPSVETALTDCERCHELAEEAERIAPLLRLGGSPSVAVHRILSGLLALDALGQPTPKISTHREARILADALGTVGAWVRWSQKFTGTLEKDPDTAAVDRWTFLTADDRSTLRRAAAEYMKLRIEKPADISPPSGGGCAMCGVASVRALPSRANEVWSASTAGRYTCPACTFVLRDVVGGALGATAVETAVRTFLNIKRHPHDRREFIGLTPWKDTGARPNAAPWEHLNLRQVKKLMTASW